MVSHAVFHAWLLEIGTGWIGWTEDQTLATRITTILAAYKGRVGMLKAGFGGKEEAPAAGVSPKDHAAVKALFAGLRARQAT